MSASCYVFCYSGGMKVLIIDDDNFLRTLLESELKQENIEVLLAYDGEDGIAKAKAWKPDVIVLDLIIPKKDGFEVLDVLRETPEGKRAVIFVFSSLAQEHDKSEALALGAREYFTKGEDTVHHIADTIRLLEPGISTNEK